MANRVDFINRIFLFFHIFINPQYMSCVSSYNVELKICIWVNLKYCVIVQWLMHDLKIEDTNVLCNFCILNWGYSVPATLSFLDLTFSWALLTFCRTMWLMSPEVNLAPARENAASFITSPINTLVCKWWLWC